MVVENPTCSFPVFVRGSIVLRTTATLDMSNPPLLPAQPQNRTPTHPLHQHAPVSLKPSKVHEILKNVSEEDMKVLGLNPQYSRPDWLIITVLPVPPPHVRPSVALDAGARSEDDLTHQLVSERAGPRELLFSVVISPYKFPLWDVVNL